MSLQLKVTSEKLGFVSQNMLCKQRLLKLNKVMLLRLWFGFDEIPVVLNLWILPRLAKL